MIHHLSQVNPLQGTRSSRDFSLGNTLPLAALPWGTHHWSFQTASPPWLFHPDHPKLQGIRLTHQPSPWMRDYASMLVSAFLGPIDGTVEDQSSAYRVDKAVFSPHYLRAELLRYGIVMELTPTEHGALLCFTFDRPEEPRIRLNFERHDLIAYERGGFQFFARATDHHGGVPEKFGLEIAGLFNATPLSFQKTPTGGIFIFSSNIKRLELRLAGSFISKPMAQLALDRELKGRALGDLQKAAEERWSSLLDRIEIVESRPGQRQTFYSCLYRCLLFPRFLHETNAEGQMVHWSPHDGATHEGPLCTDNGFWDTFRTLYPLLALVYPDQLRLMMEGWLNACRQAGWSPKWASPGLRDCMIGTHFDAVVAEAVSKGITDWDVAGAYDYLRKNATIPSTDGRFGRRGLDLFHRLGYVPVDRVPYSVSRTLDFAYDDFCVAQVAKWLGRADDEKFLRQRAQCYRNLFDASIGFMRGRYADGAWEDFREFRWGGSYIEGGAWQHSFNVPHDPEGLAELYGGTSVLLDKISRMLSTPPHFEIGTYPEEIHEMTEMALTHFGQYAHSNQPVHAFLFFHAYFGDWRTTTHWVHQIAHDLYTPDRLPGDEDNGEMSAWYIFACLGIYPLCPGKAEYVRFEPFVHSARVRIPGVEKTLELGKADFAEQTQVVTSRITHSALLGSAA